VAFPLFPSSPALLPQEKEKKKSVEKGKGKTWALTIPITFSKETKTGKGKAPTLKWEGSTSINPYALSPYLLPP